MAPAQGASLHPAVARWLLGAVRQLQKEVIELRKIQTQEKLIGVAPNAIEIPECLDGQAVQKCPEQMTQTVLTSADVLKVQHVDVVADATVLQQRQVPMTQAAQGSVEAQHVDEVPIIQTVQTSVGAAQVQDADEVAGVPVQVHNPAPTAQIAQKSVVPMVQCDNQVVDPPVVQQRQAPMIQTVRKFVDVPHVQFMIKHWIDEAEEVPVMQYGDEIEEEEDGSDEYPWDPYAEDYAEKMRRFYATYKEELKQYMPDGAFSESGEENDDEEESGSDDDTEFQAELMWLQEEQRRNARATRRVHFDDASDEGG